MAKGDDTPESTVSTVSGCSATFCCCVDAANSVSSVPVAPFVASSEVSKVLVPETGDGVALMSFCSLRLFCFERNLRRAESTNGGRPDAFLLLDFGLLPSLVVT